MNSSYPYPDELSRQRALERLRETNRQLELHNLQLEEILAKLEAEVRQQKRERLLKSKK
ncbi:hypothetical protein [Chroococcus sp. FPU101]|uniref:hypothetical protein n=1 Tax=Chroococcus sp. FPU101 TaxID=1974212 RepID=UPI001A8EEB7F|nr:hypothetical protein [Chroococcus sp. FPU101]GFE68654.1 hypothetical protein CFPU101_12640 [Chroococcus sp. FPU101]